MISEGNLQKAYETFSFVEPKDLFTAEVVSGPKKSGWPSISVSIIDRRSGKSVYAYNRNYSMLSTFEPFRLWDDERAVWRWFGLISPDYTTIEVVDLEEGRAICSSSNGFCPVEFFAVDFMEYIREDEEEFRESPEFYKEALATYLTRRSFAFVSGCFWGDDWSWKLRTVDLSLLLSNGVLGTAEETFGYFVLGSKLREAVDSEYFFDTEHRFLNLLTPVSFEMDGVLPKGHRLNSEFPKYEEGE